MGLYGSYNVITHVKADRYFQTNAWSCGQKANCHIYQYQNDVTLAGVAVDRDDVNEDAGLWGLEEKKVPFLAPGRVGINKEQVSNGLLLYCRLILRRNN